MRLSCQSLRQYIGHSVLQLSFSLISLRSGSRRPGDDRSALHLWGRFRQLLPWKLLELLEPMQPLISHHPDTALCRGDCDLKCTDQQKRLCGQQTNHVFVLLGAVQITRDPPRRSPHMHFPFLKVCRGFHRGCVLITCYWQAGEVVVGEAVLGDQVARAKSKLCLQERPSYSYLACLRIARHQHTSTLEISVDLGHNASRKGSTSFGDTRTS